MSKDETREKMLTAAMEIFSEKGYLAATTREIADFAGINEVTIFRHFGNKENLFMEAFNRHTVVSILARELEGKFTGNLEQDLRLLAKSYLEIALQRAKYIRRALLEQPSNPELAKMVAVIPQRLETSLTNYLRKMHQQGEIVETNFALLAKIFYDMLYSYVLTNPQPEKTDKNKLKEYVDTCVSIFIRGVIHVGD